MTDYTYDERLAAQRIVDALTGIVTGNDKLLWRDLFATLARDGLELTCMRSATCGYGWKIVVDRRCVLWWEGESRRIPSDWMFPCGYVDVPDYNAEWLRTYHPGAWEPKLMMDIDRLQGAT